MKFLCEDSCIDSGSMDNVSQKLGVPITHNYKRGVEYEIDEKQLRRLTAIGLFPEFFAYADDLARVWVEQHNDELCDIVDARVLPYRKLTKAEEQNDRDIAAGRKEGEYTLPHGTVNILKPRLVRKGQSVADAFTKGPSPLVPGPEPVTLTRRAAPAQEPPINGKKTRKPMSAAARKAAGDRLKAARAAKREKAKV